MDVCKSLPLKSEICEQLPLNSYMQWPGVVTLSPVLLGVPGLAFMFSMAAHKLLCFVLVTGDASVLAVAELC